MANYKSDKKISKEHIKNASERFENELRILKEFCPFSDRYANAYNPDEYGERVRSCRENLGFTQTKCGEIVGMTGAALSKIEKGAVKKLNPDHLYLLCIVFEVTPDYLLGLTKKRDAKVEKHVVDGKEEEKEIFMPIKFSEEPVAELATLFNANWTEAKGKYVRYPELCALLSSILRHGRDEAMEELSSSVKYIYDKYDIGAVKATSKSEEKG